MGTLDAQAMAARRSDGAEEAFRRYLDGLVHAWLGTVSILAFTLVPFFLLLDFITASGGQLPRFVLYRGLATGTCLAIFAVLRRTQPTRWSFLYGYLIAIVVGGSITVMTVELGGFDSPYYAGLHLVIAGVNLFLPWRPLQSALNGSLVIGMYAATNALFGGPYHRETLAAHLFFMSSTVVIAVAVTFVRHELTRKEFDLRSELLDSNALLEHSRQELRAARDALWGEMEVAKRIQTALLPKDQQAGGFEVAGGMFPAAEVGGDYYDIIMPPGQRPWIAIGDVSGHGVEAGLVMMMTQTAILSLVREEPGIGPAGIFRAVNGVLRENLSRLRGDRYMTLNLVRLDDDGFTLAGKHQDVLVWREASLTVDVVENEGTWLGLVSDVGDSPERHVPLAPGDAALFFTDGVTEAMAASGEQFGQDRLAQAFTQVVARPPAVAIGAILGEVAKFAAEQADDITLVIVRRLQG